MTNLPVIIRLLTKLVAPYDPGRVVEYCLIASVQETSDTDRNEQLIGSPQWSCLNPQQRVPGIGTTESPTLTVFAGALWIA